MLDKYAINLCCIRNTLGLTRAKLAEFLGEDIDMIEKYETARNEIPLRHVEKICHYFGLGYDIFFEEPDEEIRGDCFNNDDQKYKSSH